MQGTPSAEAHALGARDSIGVGGLQRLRRLPLRRMWFRRLVFRNYMPGLCRLYWKLLAMGPIPGAVDQRLLLGRETCATYHQVEDGGFRSFHTPSGDNVVNLMEASECARAHCGKSGMSGTVRLLLALRRSIAAETPAAKSTSLRSAGELLPSAIGRKIKAPPECSRCSEAGVIARALLGGSRPLTLRPRRCWRRCAKLRFGVRAMFHPVATHLTPACAGG